MSLASLPDGWQVWNEEPDGRVILAFRPDVFNSQELPAPCLPTLYVTNGSPRRRPGAGAVDTDRWHVKLFLEPEVEADTERYDAREDALNGAVAYAERFVAGEIDYRGLYQVPRDAYLDELDALVDAEGVEGSRGFEESGGSDDSDAA